MCAALHSLIAAMNSGFLIPAYLGPGAGMTFVGSFLILLVAFGLLLFSMLTWPFRAALLWYRRRSHGLPSRLPRVVVLGLDGLDPRRVRRLIGEGKLPHLKQLADQGTFRELATTLPPISPVAWSSFQTGVNPGKHNIFDFLNRDLRTYLPELSSARILPAHSGGWLSRFGIGQSPVRMLRKSQPFWKILGDHGVFSTILRVPISFPPEKFFGLSLSAMCTPDLRGTQGSFTLLTTDRNESREATGGVRIQVERKGNRIETALPGPPNVPGATPADFSIPVRIRLRPERNEAEIRLGRERVLLKPGTDSGWVRLTYRCGFWTRVGAICRLRVESIEPVFRLYVSPLHLDPERPALPISHPLYYAIYLAKLHDSYATLGLAEDTWALNSGVIDEQAFLDQAYAIHDERERMFFDALRRMPRGLTACVFDGPDRIQHMFYRHDVAGHPANSGRDCEAHAGVLDDMYARMDELVGRTVAELRPDDTLFVMSDHGFCDFRRAVNLNVWLREQGYLTLKGDAAPGEYLAGVDWSRTRAYSFGLSGIYINQQGREAQGIVPPESAAALRAEIARKLEGLEDAELFARAVRRVYDSRIAYQGPYAGQGPDLIVGYERGYRASWDNAVGRTDGPMIHDNTRLWSGDHCVDPSLVPGVLFCNRRFAAEAPSILDLAPTILQLFGVPVPGYLEGQPLRFEDARPPDEGRELPETCAKVVR